MRHIKLNALPLALTLALSCGIASAGEADGEGFHGYFRAGVGAGSGEGGRQNCFGLGGYAQRYRLGNECDSYGDFTYGREIAKSDDGVSFLATVGIQEYSPNSSQNQGTNFTAVPNTAAFADGGGPGLHFKWIKAYIDVRNISELNGGTAWVGQPIHPS